MADSRGSPLRTLSRAALAALLAWRRGVFLTRLRLSARLRGVALELRVGRNFVVGKGVKAELGGRRVLLEIGDDVTFADRVRFMLVDAEVRLGAGSALKRECLIHVFGGRFTLDGMCGLSQRCVVHCAEEITIAKWTVVSEYATLVDSLHAVPTAPVERNWLRDEAAVEKAPIRIGSHVFVGAKATILKGVTIGECSIVAANSLVMADVPPLTMAIGVPARRIPRRRPESSPGGA